MSNSSDWENNKKIYKKVQYMIFFGKKKLEQLTDIKQTKTGLDTLTKFDKLFQKGVQVLKTKFCKVIKLKQK